MSVSVSVLIDTYNHEKYISAAIKSVLDQRALGDAVVEILVIDDGSTDRTGEIAQSFGSAVRYLRKANGGQASAFNCGIPLCRGEIICFLDGDDWWHRLKLRTVIDALQRNPEVCAVGHSIVEVDELAGIASKVGPPAPFAIDFGTPTGIALFHRFACCLGTSRLTMKRSAALALLDIPEKLIFEADEYMFTLLPMLGKVVILPEALTYYRIHGGNLYQGSQWAPVKYRNDLRLRTRALIYDCLSKKLPDEFRRRGCDEHRINAILGPIQVEASRLKFMTCGGSPLENFRSELRASEFSVRSGALSKVVLWISLGLALVCPPKWYFRVRQMYANWLRRIRPSPAGEN